MSEIISIIDSILYSHGKSPDLWLKLSKKYHNTNQEDIIFVFNEMKKKITTLNTDSILLSMDILDYSIDTGNLIMGSCVASENSIKFFTNFLQSNIDKKMSDKILYLIKKWAKKFGKQYKNLSSYYLSLTLSGFQFPENYEDTYLKYIKINTTPTPNKNYENTSKGENFDNNKKVKYTPIDPKNYLKIINFDFNTTSYEKKYSRLINKLYDFTHAIQESNILINKNCLGKDSEKIDKLCKELSFGKMQLIETIKSDRLKNEKLMDITLKVKDDIETTIERREKQKLKKVPFPFFTSFYQVLYKGNDINNGYKISFSTNFENKNLNLAHLHKGENLLNSLIDDEEKNINMNLTNITKSDDFTDKIIISDKFNNFVNKVEREQKIWTNDGEMITNDGMNYYYNNKNIVNNVNNNMNNKNMMNLNNNNINKVKGFNNVDNNIDMSIYRNQNLDMNNNMINNNMKNNIDMSMKDNIFNNIYNNKKNNMSNGLNNNLNPNIRSNMVLDYFPHDDLNSNLNNRNNINNILNSNMSINNVNQNIDLNYNNPNIKKYNNIQNYSLNNSNQNMSMNNINPNPNMNINYNNQNKLSMNSNNSNYKIDANIQNDLRMNDAKLNNRNSNFNNFSNFSSVSYSVSENQAPFLDEILLNNKMLDQNSIQYL